MPRYHVDFTKIGTFRSEDLPSDAELQQFYEELIVVGDKLQEKYSTQFLHLLLNSYIRRMRTEAGRRFVAAEFYNVVLWQTSNDVICQIDEEEIPCGISVEDGDG